MATDSPPSAPDPVELNWSDYRPGAGLNGTEATPVVLIHGITEQSTAWQPVAERLSTTRRVIAVDLRGHGQSPHIPPYDIETLTADVAHTVTRIGLERPHIVGHSLGGVVASLLGASGMARTVTNVDQSLQLAALKDQLLEIRPALEDPTSFPQVLGMLFDQLMGDRLPARERERLAGLRRPDQEVVLGIWSILFDGTPDEITATIDQSLAGYAAHSTPYLSVFGVDPGTDYETWLLQRINNARVEIWDGHDHYPHLIDPDRFVERLERFWI